MRMEGAHNRSGNAITSMDEEGERSVTEVVDCVMGEEYSLKLYKDMTFNFSKECQRNQEFRTASTQNSIQGIYSSMQVNPGSFSGKSGESIYPQQPKAKVNPAPVPSITNPPKHQPKSYPSSMPSSRLVKFVFNLNPACRHPSNVPHTCAHNNSGSVGIMSTCKLGASSVRTSTATSRNAPPVYSGLGKVPGIPIANTSTIVKETDLVPLKPSDIKKSVLDIMQDTQAMQSKCAINSVFSNIQERPLISTKSISNDTIPSYSVHTNRIISNNSTQENLSNIKSGRENNCLNLQSNQESCSKKDDSVSTSIRPVTLPSDNVPLHSKTVNIALSKPNLPRMNIRIPFTPVLQQNTKTDLTRTYGPFNLLPANLLCNILPSTAGQTGHAQPISVTNSISGTQTIQNLGNQAPLIPNYYIVVNNNLQGMLNPQVNTSINLSTSVSASSTSTTSTGAMSTNACSFPIQQLLSSTAISQSSATSTIPTSTTSAPGKDNTTQGAATAPAASMLTLQQLFATPPANPMILTIPVNVIASTSSSVSIANKTVKENEGIIKRSRSSEGQSVHPLLKTPPKKIRIEPLKTENNKKKLKDIKPKDDKTVPSNMKSEQPNQSIKMSDSITDINTFSAEVKIPLKMDGIGETGSSSVSTNACENRSQSSDIGHGSEVEKQCKFKYQFWVPPTEEQLPVMPKKKAKENVTVVPKQRKPKRKRKKLKGKELKGSTPKLPKTISEVMAPMLTPPSTRDKKKLIGPSSGTKRKLKKKLQNSSKAKKPRVENDMSKYISVLKVQSKSAAQGKTLAGMLKNSGQGGFSVSRESAKGQCVRSANSTTTGTNHLQKSCGKTHTIKTEKCTKHKIIAQVTEARSDIDMNNNVSVRRDSTVRSETNQPSKTQKSLTHNGMEEAESKGPVLFSFLQDVKLPNTTLQSSEDKLTSSNAEEVQGAVLEHIEREMRILKDLPQSVLMKAPAPGPIPLISMWTNRYDLQREKSCLGRLTLVLQDAHLNLRQSLMGDKIATERLKRKLIYAETLVKKYKDFLAIRLHAFGEY